MSDLSDTLRTVKECHLAGWRIGSATRSVSSAGSVDDGLGPAAGLCLGLALSTVIWLGVATALLRFW
jgi:hypothetical protein